MKARKANETSVDNVRQGKKKWVRYDEGAQMYSLGINTFTKLAQEAKAIYHIKKIVLVNTEILDEYLEMFRDEF